MTGARTRGAFPTIMALLFGLLALSNFTKAIQHQRSPATMGIVILGVRFESLAANLVLGASMGAVLAVYAWGLWRMRRWVAPLSIAYAFYVPTNLVLWWYWQTSPAIPPLGFIVGYLFLALGGSIGTALYLAYHRDALA